MPMKIKSLLKFECWKPLGPFHREIYQIDQRQWNDSLRKRYMISGCDEHLDSNESVRLMNSHIKFCISSSYEWCALAYFLRCLLLEPMLRGVCVCNIRIMYVFHYDLEWNIILYTSWQYIECISILCSLVPWTHSLFFLRRSNLFCCTNVFKLPLNTNFRFGALWVS